MADNIEMDIEELQIENDDLMSQVREATAKADMWQRRCLDIERELDDMKQKHQTSDDSIS